MPVPFQIINVRAKNIRELFATVPELYGLKTRLLKIFQRPIGNNSKNR